jgi:hypothetical protein
VSLQCCHFSPACHGYWILISKFCGIWIQGSGAAGYVASTTYFFKSFEG